ncbi:single-stranded-DNA-specific exonuclease RecJ [Candidatus Pelagibacter sp.]|nr:single-stranded-DNA-specific exonuclease RecJ [Candidatus Pelagibacter sp.]
MISVSGKNWEEVKVSKRVIDKVIIDLDLSIIQSKIVISRNFSNDEIFLLNNKVNYTNPFFKNKDFLSACSLINNAIKNKDRILIIGDYDVDGCVSTSLLVNFFKKFKLNIDYYIPDRLKDGYGANKDLINKLISKKKTDLIIFVDCGSSAQETIDLTNKLNVKSLIIDHHNIQKPYPKSNVFLNPKKNLDYKNYDYLCTAYLTYLLIDLYIKLYELKISFKKDLIYVLLASVADVMPLRGINKILAKNVLKDFKVNNNFIIGNLLKISNQKKKIELDDLGYFIAPIFNSAGRLDNANQIIELLTTTSKKKILEISNYIYNLNIKRKSLEDLCFKNLNFKNISNQKGIIFIMAPDIHEGIIGIIAAKIKENFGKPCIVFTNSGEFVKGSARSTSNFNIGEYINRALQDKLIISGGGHNLAAGVSLLKSKIDLFQKYLNKFYAKKNFDLTYQFISKLSLSSVNKNFVKDINILGPFGNQNPNPIFLIECVKLIKPQILKNKFISCYIKSTNKIVKAISFSPINSVISYEIINNKNNLDIIIQIKENNWNNKNSTQLEIIDIIKRSNNT